MRLLVTRPEPDGERTAQALRAQGHGVMLAPMLRIVPVADAELGVGPWDAVVMTSANAARSVASHRRRAEFDRRPAIVVGERAAQAARKADFADVRWSNGGVVELAALVAATIPSGKRLLYLAGTDRAGDFVGMLGAKGFRVDCAEVYRAIAAREFPADVRAATSAGEIDAILHFSARSAAACMAAASADGMLNNILILQHLCLSPQIAAALSGVSPSQIKIADRPDEAAMLNLTAAA